MGETMRGFDAVAFFDVDGTLVWRDFEEMERSHNETVNEAPDIKPSSAVADAFSRMRERGHATFICTGRPLPFVMPSLLALEPTGIVASSGAYVSVGGEVVRDLCIPDDVVLATAERFIAAGIDVTFESDTKNIELHPSGAPCRFGSADLVCDMAGFTPFVGTRRFQKLCSNGVSIDELASIRAFLDEHFTICDLQGGVFEYSLKGVDKGTGIEAALAHLGHGRARTFAFGDSENDLSMALAVETFVAMGNALPGVKAVADYVTDSAAQDGVATGLAHFGLI